MIFDLDKNFGLIEPSDYVRMSAYTSISEESDVFRFLGSDWSFIWFPIVDPAAIGAIRYTTERVTMIRLGFAAAYRVKVDGETATEVNERMMRSTRMRVMEIIASQDPIMPVGRRIIAPRLYDGDCDDIDVKYKAWLDASPIRELIIGAQ